jgi:hypothetical protein
MKIVTIEVSRHPSAEFADAVERHPEATIVATRNGQAVAVSTPNERRMAARNAERGRAGGKVVTPAKLAALERARAARAEKKARAGK